MMRSLPPCYNRKIPEPVTSILKAVPGGIWSPNISIEVVPSKWRNPHLYKLYGYGLCKEKHTPPNPQIALYNLVQETLQIRYLKLLVIIHVYVLYLCISTNQWIYDDIWICHTF